MAQYEYRCKSCDNQIVSSARLEDNCEYMDDWAHDGEQPYLDEFREMCGPLKRVWSVGFQIKSTDWSH